MKCLNVFVFYNNYNEIVDYIDELVVVGANYVDIAIVVNSDQHNDIKSLKHKIETIQNIKIRVFDFGANVGYLNAFLKVIKEIDINRYDYLILSNSDIKYRDKDFFKKLCKSNYSNKIGCIAPSVYALKNESYSNPHYLCRIPKRKLIFLESIFSKPLLAKFYLKLAGLKGKTKKSIEQPSCYVYSPHGCYMIFTKFFVMCIRNYLYGVLLYSEESAVGELLRKHQLKCYYDNTLKVAHNESEVTGKINYKKRFQMWRESITYILGEFY